VVLLPRTLLGAVPLAAQSADKKAGIKTAAQLRDSATYQIWSKLL